MWFYYYYMLGDTATQNTHTERVKEGTGRERETEREKERWREHILHMFRGKIQFHLPEAHTIHCKSSVWGSLFILLVCVFVCFFVFFPLLLHCMFSKTNVNLLKNCDMLQHALWAPAPHVCMSRVQTFVCLRKKNDSKCNAKMLARKKSRETERKKVS